MRDNMVLMRPFSRCLIISITDNLIFPYIVILSTSVVLSLPHHGLHRQVFMLYVINLNFGLSLKFTFFLSVVQQIISNELVDMCVKTTPVAFLHLVKIFGKLMFKYREFSSVYNWAYTIWTLDFHFLLRIVYAKFCTILFNLGLWTIFSQHFYSI